ncbi:type II toxin-antitoxin system RelE/ParE family toxin [Serratia sp. D1N4]
MTAIKLPPKVMDDIERILEHLSRYDVANSPLRIQEIIQAISVLEHNPLIGKSINRGMRELVIGYQARGYVALYRYIPDIDTILVLAIRSQRELGY